MFVIKNHTIPFLALYPYPTNRVATTPELRERQKLVYSLKGTGAPGTTRPRTVEFTNSLLADKSAVAFFPNGSVLVPVPTSKVTTLPATDAWAGNRIAQALCAAGLGGFVVTALRRTKPVTPSHLAGPGERLTVAEHEATLQCDRTGLEAKTLILVDDVLTRGSTISACLLKLRAAGYSGSVRAVAACYTADPPYPTPLEPRLGVVQYTEGAPYATW